MRAVSTNPPRAEGRNGGERSFGELHPLLDRETEWLARDAGYDSAAAFLGYFEKTYGLPFYGVLLRW